MSDDLAMTSPMQPPLPEVVQLTADAAEQLQQDLKLLQTVARPEAVRRIQRAKLFLGPGQAELAARPAIWDLEALDRKIADLETLLARAQVIVERPSSTVKLGSTVTVRYDNGTEETLKLVPSLEADLARGYVASESRVGKALLGKASGEKVTVDADGIVMTLAIDRIGSPKLSA